MDVCTLNAESCGISALTTSTNPARQGVIVVEVERWHRKLHVASQIMRVSVLVFAIIEFSGILQGALDHSLRCDAARKVTNCRTWCRESGSRNASSLNASSNQLTSFFIQVRMTVLEKIQGWMYIIHPDHYPEKLSYVQCGRSVNLATHQLLGFSRLCSSGSCDICIVAEPPTILNHILEAYSR
jgi:hypothetical protein